MPAPPLLDVSLLAGRLRRARQASGADFLLKRAADDLADRLAVVLRTFAEAADVATPGPHFAEAVALTKPGSRVTRVASSPDADGGLGLPAQRFDLIVSGLALQHANDMPGSLIQIRRALRPDGLFLGCLAGGATLTELRQSLAEAESAIAGGLSPRVLPFVDVRDMGGLLQRAGFALPVADSETVTVRYADIFGLMADLRAMGATNVLCERSRRFTPRALFAQAAEAYARRFADEDGRIRATFELIWLSGWAPHESQQKPLKPGSAQARLADALGVKEGGT